MFIIRKLTWTEEYHHYSKFSRRCMPPYGYPHSKRTAIIIIIIIIRIFIHTRSTQILITTVYTQLDNTNAKIIK